MLIFYIITCAMIGLAAVIGVLLLIAAMQPDDFRIARSEKMAATPATIFANVNELRRWQAWSPWEKLDPNLAREYSGPPAGVGASYAWTGNKKVGQGSMTITDSQPHRLIQIRLEFFKPFAATNISDFAFEPHGDQTHVTWSMTGRNNLMGKLFGLLMNMDKLVGKDFEKGLANLKAVSEASQPAPVA